MKCDEIQGKLDAFLKNQMSLRELSDFLAHIDGCPSCYEELETYYTVEVALNYLDSNEVESYNIPLRLTKTLESARKRVKRETMMYRCFLAIVFLLAVLLIILLVSMNFTDLEEGLARLLGLLFRL